MIAGLLPSAMTPPRACGRLIASQPAAAVFRGHSAEMFALTFRPDGRQLATGSEDRTARIWSVDAPERRPVVLPEHSNVVTALAFSNDGAGWAASSDKTARLWHTQLGDLIDLACATVGRNLSMEERISSSSSTGDRGGQIFSKPRTMLRTGSRPCERGRIRSSKRPRRPRSQSGRRQRVD